MAASGVYYGNRLMGYHIYWRDLWRALLAAALMAGAVWLLPLDGLPLLITGALAGAAVYGAVLLLLRTFSAAELQKMRAMAASALPKRLNAGGKQP
jgi:hypothetical protein